MSTVTLEQLISTFGEETGKQMFAQMNASGGGSTAPFPFLKKVSTHGSEVGAFGDFVYGVKTEVDPKDKDNRIVVDKGTNIGTKFEFFLVNVSYRYTLWDEVKGKSYRSNIFADLKTGMDTAVDAYSGDPLPIGKEAKKAAGWKLNRINAGLVRKNEKEPWVPVIFETAGSLYFTLGELIGKKPSGGLLTGIATLVMKLASKGSTQYSVVDVVKSSFTPITPTFWADPEISKPISEITNKMTEYRKANQYTPATPEVGADNKASSNVSEEDETEW